MNRYSKERQYTTPRSPYDMDFIAQAMAYKQSKMDANRAMIQQNIDNIVGLDIDKPEAREYLNKRVEQLLANVNQYGAVDLSSDGIARNIASYVSSAIDDTIINAYAGTMEGRKMEKYYDDLMINDPNKYNERNKAFAMAPYYQWLQDGQAGSRLAPLQVSNYVDYREEAENVLKQVREAQKSGQEIQYPDPNNPGYMITEKIDQMTEDQVQQIAYNMMSEGAKKQMYIDGWYMSQTQPELFTNDALSGYVNTFNQSFDRKRDAIRAEMAGAISDPRRYNELYAAYQTLIDKRESFNTRAQQIFGSGDAAQMGAFMVENNFLNGLGKTWAYSNSQIKYEKDGAYWAEKDHEFKVLKAQQDAAIEREKMNRDNELNKAKINYYNAKAAKELGQVGSGGGNLSDVATRYNEVVSTSGELQRSTDYISSLMESATKSKIDNTNRLMRSLKKEDQKLVQQWIDEKKENGGGEYKNLSQDEMVRRYFNENGGASNEMLSNGDARTNYLALKEAELNESTAMGAINGYMDFQKEVLSSLDEKTFYFSTFDLLRLMSNEVNTSKEGTLYFMLDKDKVNSVKNRALVQNISDMIGVEMEYNGYGNPLITIAYWHNPYTKEYLNTGAPGLSGLNMSGIGSNVAGSTAGGVLSGGILGGALGAVVGGIGAVPGATFGGLTGAVVGAGTGLVSGFAEQYEKMGSKLYSHLLDKYNGDKDAADAEYANIMRVRDDKEYENIADDYVRNMKTPLGYIINNDAKLDSEKRKQFNTLTDLYIQKRNVSEAEKTNIRNRIGERGIVATVVLSGEDNKDMVYGLLINGDPTTFVEIDKGTLAANGIKIDETNPIPAENIRHTESNVFFPGKNDFDYAKLIARTTGLTAITSKTDMFKSIVNNDRSLFMVPSVNPDDKPRLTQVGSEIEELVIGADKFAVGIEGYKANGIPGIRVFIYDKAQQEGLRQPIYQYSIEVEEGNESYKWLYLCPQYYLYRAYNMMIDEYKSTLEMGSESGKESINKALNVVRR